MTIITSYKITKNNYRLKSILPTSVQSLSRRTVVSVGLMFIVLSSIKLFKELPPAYEKYMYISSQYYTIKTSKIYQFILQERAIN